MKIKIAVLVFTTLLAISNNKMFAQETNIDSTQLDEISKLELALIEKDIEIAKGERTLGYVIATPTAAFTILSTTFAILYPPGSDDQAWYPIIGVTVLSAVLSYVGIDKIISANEEISKLEKEKTIQFGLSYKPNTESFLINLQIQL